VKDGLERGKPDKAVMDGHRADLGLTITVCCKSAGSAVQFLSFYTLPPPLLLSFRPVPRPRVVRKKLTENCVGYELNSSRREIVRYTFGSINLLVNELACDIRHSSGHYSEHYKLVCAFPRTSGYVLCDRSARYERSSRSYN